VEHTVTIIAKDYMYPLTVFVVSEVLAAPEELLQTAGCFEGA
jgi:hypothetical protein